MFITIPSVLMVMVHKCILVNIEPDIVIISSTWKK